MKYYRIGTYHKYNVEEKMSSWRNLHLQTSLFHKVVKHDKHSSGVILIPL